MVLEYLGKIPDPVDYRILISCPVVVTHKKFELTMKLERQDILSNVKNEEHVGASNELPDQESFCIPYGSNIYKPDLRELESKSADRFVPRPGVPAVQINRNSHVSLKINNTSLTFKTPPRPGELIDADAQLVFVRQYLDGLCGQWNKLLKLFIKTYFEDLEHEVETNGPKLDGKIENVKGLCERRHWCFSALMPLPRAHIYIPHEKKLSKAEAKDFVCADFAFWDGNELVVVFINSGQSLIGSKKLDRQRVEELTPRVIEIPSDALQNASRGTLLSMLGPQFRQFWKQELFPSTPFRGRGISDPV